MEKKMDDKETLKRKREKEEKEEFMVLLRNDMQKFIDKVELVKQRIREDEELIEHEQRLLKQEEAMKVSFNKEQLEKLDQKKHLIKLKEKFKKKWEENFLPVWENYLQIRKVLLQAWEKFQLVLENYVEGKIESYTQGHKEFQLVLEEYIKKKEQVEKIHEEELQPTVEEMDFYSRS